MRISPLWLTIILAIITGVLVFAIWVPISGYFHIPGTPEGEYVAANTSSAAPISTVNPTIIQQKIIQTTYSTP